MRGERGTRRELYDATADDAARGVIRRYSTSFAAASRMLDRGLRQYIANVYALVRVADEIVDGGAAEAGLDAAGARAVLDGLERETVAAVATGYSANPVVHAFARTARWAGFGAELTAPFFASMRADLDRAVHDDESFAAYVYGSAEVVGLMCLRVFVRDATLPPGRLGELERGARALGAAFQKVNFLRDLGADADGLGRSYFPGVDPARLTEADKERILDDIDADLAAAGSALPLLPPGSRRAVALAHRLFAELSRRLRATPAADIPHRRIRVPDAVKLRIALAVVAGGGR